MRIWSLHPKYLDTKGLVALWREALLAKHVLEGKTKGYKNHPQLNRFKSSTKHIDNINQYLAVVHKEATIRKYAFDKAKVDWKFKRGTLNVTNGQIKYEISHLLNKLKSRDPERFRKLKKIKLFEAHPLFTIIDGEIEDWEVIQT
jgi:hypothetical protein